MSSNMSWIQPDPSMRWPNGSPIDLPLSEHPLQVPISAPDEFPGLDHGTLMTNLGMLHHLATTLAQPTTHFRKYKPPLSKVQAAWQRCRLVLGHNDDADVVSQYLNALWVMEPATSTKKRHMDDEGGMDVDECTNQGY